MTVTDLMAQETLMIWEQIFTAYVSSTMHHSDASHDMAHFQRVFHMTTEIAAGEPAPTDRLILLAAAYFHDIVNLPKDHPESKKSSYYSAVKAQEILTSLGFPEKKIPAVYHAIHAHSFSAGLQPETLEAKILQDADRMDALGALGILRVFYVTGLIKGSPYDIDDLFAKKRPLNDKLFALDHFYCKLFKIPALLQTERGRHIAAKRAAFLQFYIDTLVADLKRGEGGALVLTWACYDAGSHGTQLFDTLDPLASHRPLAPRDYVLDCLLEMRQQFPEFVLPFLAQFSEEVMR